MLKNEKNFDDFEKNCQSVNKTTDFNVCQTNFAELPLSKANGNEKTVEFTRPKRKITTPPVEKSQKNRRNPLGTLIRENASAALTIASVAVFSAACLLLPHIVSYDVVRDGEIAADSSQNGVTDTTHKSSVSEEIRIFREYNGKVGVFFLDGTLDFMIETPFESLPEYDRKLLENGIIAQGKEEIAFLAEGLEE